LPKLAKSSNSTAGLANEQVGLNKFWPDPNSNDLYKANVGLQIDLAIETPESKGTASYLNRVRSGPLQSFSVLDDLAIALIDDRLGAMRRARTLRETDKLAFVAGDDFVKAADFAFCNLGDQDDDWELLIW
jgi:hypothetical protein